MAVQMLNCIIAAFSQVGNLARAFETFEAVSGLGLMPDTDSYNALMEGLVNHGQAAALPKANRLHRPACRRSPTLVQVAVLFGMSPRTGSN